MKVFIFKFMLVYFHRNVYVLNAFSVHVDNLLCSNKTLYVNINSSSKFVFIFECVIADLDAIYLCVLIDCVVADLDAIFLRVIFKCVVADYVAIYLWVIFDVL